MIRSIEEVAPVTEYFKIWQTMSIIFCLIKSHDPSSGREQNQHLTRKQRALLIGALRCIFAMAMLSNQCRASFDLRGPFDSVSFRPTLRQREQQIVFHLTSIIQI